MAIAMRVRERDDWFFFNEGSAAPDDNGTISISKFNQQDAPREEGGESNGDDASGESDGGDDREGIPPSATVASSPRKRRKPRKREGAKRTPPNGYVRFADDVRPRIARDNPGLKVYEMVRVRRRRRSFSCWDRSENARVPPVRGRRRCRSKRRSCRAVAPLPDVSPSPNPGCYGRCLCRPSPTSGGTRDSTNAVGRLSTTSSSNVSAFVVPCAERQGSGLLAVPRFFFRWAGLTLGSKRQNQ